MVFLKKKAAILAHAPFRLWVIWAMAFIMLSGLCGTATAADEQKADSWRFSVTPYLWYAGFSGDLWYSGSGGTPDVEVSQEQTSGELDMVLMLGAEASKGAFSILTQGKPFNAQAASPGATISGMQF